MEPTSQRVESRTLIGNGFPVVHRHEPSVVVSGELVEVSTHEPPAARGAERRAQVTELAMAVDPSRRTRLWIAAGAAAAIVAGVITGAARWGANETLPPAPAGSPARADAVERTVAPTASEPPVASVAPPPVDKAASPATTAGAAIRVGEGSCRLHVTSEPGDGVVMVDGRVVGSTPLDVEGVYCGRRTRVAISRAGFVPWDRRIVAEEGVTTPVTAALHRPGTPVVITSTPAGARVALDGQMVGTTPTAVIAAPGTRHSVEIVLEGYVPYRTQVVPRSDRKSIVDAPLSLADAPLIVEP